MHFLFSSVQQVAERTTEDEEVSVCWMQEASKKLLVNLFAGCRGQHGTAERTRTGRPGSWEDSGKCDRTRRNCTSPIQVKKIIYIASPVTGIIMFSSSSIVDSLRCSCWWNCEVEFWLLIFVRRAIITGWLIGVLFMASRNLAGVRRYEAELGKICYVRERQN